MSVNVIGTFSKNEIELVTRQGYPKFNDYAHTLIELTENHTLSVKMPNGEYITFSFIGGSDNFQSWGDIDIKYHGSSHTVKALGFNESKTVGTVEDFKLLALDFNKKRGE